MKPLPDNADPQYIASMIALYIPSSEWKAKLETIPEDKREAVRAALKDYWTIAQNRRRMPAKDGYTGLSKAPKMEKGK